MNTAVQKKRQPVLWLIVALIPVILSFAVHLMPAATPVLVVSKDKPSLIFESYLIDRSQTKPEMQPVISEDFYFRNIGDQDVEITELVPSCGCLSPQVSSRTLKPGDAGKLTIPVKTASEPAGPREYLVTVKYTDPDPREVLVTWKVQMPEKQVVVEPRVLMVLGQVNAGEEHRIQIVDYRPSAKDQPMTIEEVQSSNSLFTAEHAGSVTQEDAVRQTIRLKLADALPPGQHRGVVSVITNDAAYPVLQIPVILGSNRRSDSASVSVTPELARVVVNTGDPSRSSGMTVNVEVPGDWKFSHAEVYPAPLAINVREVSLGSGERTALAAVISVPSSPRAGLQQGAVTLHCMQGETRQVVTVPLSIVWNRTSPEGNAGE